MGQTVLTLTVLDGDTVSDFLPSGALKHADVISIKAPPTIGTAGVMTVEASDVRDTVATDSDFAALQSNGEDIVLAADKMTTITNIAFRSLRISTAADPGEDLTFSIIINDTTH